MRAVLVEAFSPGKTIQIREISNPRCHAGEVRVGVAAAV
jgi:NADPH:quinone reductase-like Zn-dependent oxidoreductase